jgi:hypothetical protein
MGGRPGGGGMPNMNPQQQQLLMKLLTNPETAEFFKDKDFLAKLQMLQTDPMKAM